MFIKETSITNWLSDVTVEEKLDIILTKNTDSISDDDFCRCFFPRYSSDGFFYDLFFCIRRVREQASGGIVHQQFFSWCTVD